MKIVGRVGCLIAMLTLPLVTACSSSSGGTGATGGGGAGTGGSGASTNTGTGAVGGTGTGGVGGTTTTTTTTTTTCFGDQTTWDGLTAGPISCTKNSDCCVIVNGCLSQTQVVSAADKDAAKAAWAYCESECNNCVPPPTQVGCNNGVCTGQVVDFADASAELMEDHCGVDGLEIPVGGLKFGCGLD
jgi:hypothetical protein